MSGAVALVLASLIAALVPVWMRQLDKRDFKTDLEKRCNDRVKKVQAQAKDAYDEQVDRAVAMQFSALREERELRWRYELLGDLEVMDWLDDHPCETQADVDCTVVKHLRVHRDLAGNRLRELLGDD